MNDIAKTGVFVGGAVVATLLAWISVPGAIELDRFSDQGELLFPKFTDPLVATSLRVAWFDKDRAEIREFKVERQAGLWTIPSHSHYPADADNQMKDAATLLIGIHKQRVVSDDRKQHVELGVVDPDRQELQLEGRGLRVTFQDSAGNKLGDLILGKDVPGEFDKRYVRYPKKNRVYIAEIRGEVSIEFGDWIDKDILRTGSWDMTGIVWDNYSVDESRGTVVPGEKVEVRKNDKSVWEIVGLGPDEETDTAKVGEVASALSSLEIVGVRPKPEGLTEALEAAQGFELVMLRDMVASKGFFMSTDIGARKLYSNEGDILVHTRNGVEYILRFGELVPGTGIDITSGAELPDKDEPKQDVEDGVIGPEAAKGGAHRYLMISARFDESLLEPVEGTPIAEDAMARRREARTTIEQIRRAIQEHKDKNGELPADLAALTQAAEEGAEPLLKELKKDPWDNDFVYTRTDDGDGYQLLSLGADGKEAGDLENTDIDADAFEREDAFSKAINAKKEFDRKVEEGEKKAVEANRRFGPWYYVIDAEGFDKLKVGRAALVKEKKVEPADEVPKDGGK